jgi:hypothetical protein
MGSFATSDGVVVVNLGAYVRWSYGGTTYESRSNSLIYGNPLYLPLIFAAARPAGK